MTFIEYAVSNGQGTLLHHGLEAVGTSDIVLHDTLNEGEIMVSRLITDREIDEFVDMHGGSIAVPTYNTSDFITIHGGERAV